jgi:hypothetical protein
MTNHSNKKAFSKRNNLRSGKKHEIIIREDAPKALREFVYMEFTGSLGKLPSQLRKITTTVLKTPPDYRNFSENPDIASEVLSHLDSCEWYLIYDIIEAIFKSLNQEQKEEFTNEMNYFFESNGIGWKLEDGLIEYRGDDNLEFILENSKNALEAASLPTALSEIQEAILDLSKRPDPDITGAIQHSMACLECVSREISGKKNLTFGEILKENQKLKFMPVTLQQALEKIWGFTSENGRHSREGRKPELIEAELVVGVTSSAATYLAKKIVDKNVSI